jgi:hypothetical protein
MLHTSNIGSPSSSIPTRNKIMKDFGKYLLIQGLTLELYVFLQMLLGGAQRIGLVAPTISILIGLVLFKIDVVSTIGTKRNLV